MHAFSEGALSFGGSKVVIQFKAWRDAARTVFSMPPTSAASERVFALLKNMFGSDQLRALADYIQIALMLRYLQPALCRLACV